ncbi:haloacid dehalogenase type II [Pararhodobacter sp. SW119]|uniref:haloacid dehalogenase type II n=1 Tax=Pararhodobacter sp. SW119 TaxID=2780075 RepID=UPI001ADEDA43|nr:haloacid dehalogenase type II [Pararhodobacter sp. SW119]
MPITACIFDAYGTLFDVGAAARVAASEPGAEAWSTRWPELAADWRRKQLEYTWIRAGADAHLDFWQVTQDGLDWALERHGLTEPDLRERLLALYMELAAYPEVPEMLAGLQKAGKRCAILSNGTPDMLAAAIRSAGLDDLLEAALSVEDVGVFKPDARVYDLVEAKLGVAPDAVLFVSSNGWDACSAAAYGFTTVWVNREGAPLDRLHEKPAHVLPDLTGLPDLVARIA